MINFLNRYWLPIGIIILMFFICFQNGNKLTTKIVELEKDNLRLEQAEKQYLQEIEDLKDQDTVYVDRIKKIKEIVYEQVAAVDSLSVSELQDFFSGRYPEEGSDSQ